jgi:hypothetical protein
MASAMGVARIPTQGIVAALGNHLYRIAKAINRLSRVSQAAGWFKGHTQNDFLARRDAAQNAACMIAGKAVRRHFIAVLGTALARNLHTVPDFNPFHRVYAHERTSKVGIETRKNRLTQTHRHVTGHY